jgi:hypothetical protein
MSFVNALSILGSASLAGLLVSAFIRIGVTGLQSMSQPGLPLAHRRLVANRATRFLVMIAVLVLLLAIVQALIRVPAETGRGDPEVLLPNALQADFPLRISDYKLEVVPAVGKLTHT